MTTSKEIIYTIEVEDDGKTDVITIKTQDINWSMEQYIRNRKVSEWKILKMYDKIFIKNEK